MAKRKAAAEQPDGIEPGKWYAEAEQLLRLFDSIHSQYADARPLNSLWQFDDEETQTADALQQGRQQAAANLHRHAEQILATLGSLARIGQPPLSEAVQKAVTVLGVFDCSHFGECLTAWEGLQQYGYLLRRWTAELAPYWQWETLTVQRNAMFQRHLENCPYRPEIQRILRNRLRLEHGQLLRDYATQNAVATAAAAKPKRRREAPANLTKKDLVYFYLRGWHGYATSNWNPGPVAWEDFKGHIANQANDRPSPSTISRFFKKHFGSYDGYAILCRTNRIEGWFRGIEGEVVEVYQGWQSDDED